MLMTVAVVAAALEHHVACFVAAVVVALEYHVTSVVVVALEYHVTSIAAVVALELLPLGVMWDVC